MQYKTIVLELLRENPMRYQQLRTERRLMPTLNRTARALKARHAYWIETLVQERPGSDPRQLSSEALEIAVQELGDSLPVESPPNGSAPETASLDAAMALLRRHTPPA
jgi:hypothetical protein